MKNWSLPIVRFLRWHDHSCRLWFVAKLSVHSMVSWNESRRCGKKNIEVRSHESCCCFSFWCHYMQVGHFVIVFFSWFFLCVGCGTDEIYTSIVFWLCTQFFHCVRHDVLTQQFNDSNAKQIASAYHVMLCWWRKGTTEFKYIIHFFCGHRVCSSWYKDGQQSLMVHFFHACPILSGNRSNSKTSCVFCAVLLFAVSCGQCLVFLPNMQPLFATSSGQYLLFLHRNLMLPPYMQLPALASVPPIVEEACCFSRYQADTFLSETATNFMLKLARYLCALRFVYPRKVFDQLLVFLTIMTNSSLQCL